MTQTPTGDPDVVDDHDAHRYEIRSASQLAGFAVYESVGDRLAFTHTEIDPAFEGQGLGGRLIEAALDDLRRRRVEAVPICPFVVDYVRRHPEYLDLVAEEHRGDRPS